MKFLPDADAQADERLSPEIPVICPTPVKGTSSTVVNASFHYCFHSMFSHIEDASDLIYM